MAEAGKKFPREPVFAWTRGIAFQFQGDKENAKKAYRRALQIDPEFASAQWLLSQVALDPEESLAALEACRSISPVADACLTEQMVASASLGNCEETIRLSKALIQMNPERSLGWLGLGWTLSHGNQPERIVRRALMKAYEKHEDPEFRKLQEKRLEWQIAIWYGRLDEAVEVAKSMVKMVAGSSKDDEKRTAYRNLLEAMELVGAPLAERQAVAREYLDESILNITNPLYGRTLSFAYRPFYEEKTPNLDKLKRDMQLKNNKGAITSSLTDWHRLWSAVSTDPTMVKRAKAEFDTLKLEPYHWLYNTRTNLVIGEVLSISGDSERGAQYFRHAMRDCWAVTQAAYFHRTKELREDVFKKLNDRTGLELLKKLAH